MNPFTTPASIHRYKQCKNPGRFTDLFKGIFKYTQRELPTAGAQNYSYDRIALPEQAVWGWGYMVKDQYYATAKAPYLWANVTTPTSGLGGLQHGQLARQPLISSYGASS